MAISFNDDGNKNASFGDHIDIEALSEVLGSRADEWVPTYFPNARLSKDRSEWRLANIRGDPPRDKGSCKINRTGDQPGSWFEFEDGTKGGALSTLKIGSGLDGGELIDLAIRLSGFDPARSPRRNGNGRTNGHAKDDAASLRDAARLWAAAVPLEGTLAETYLAARSIGFIPPCGLRFNNDTLFWATRSGEPAIIAQYSNYDGTPTGSIHRTYLKRDGSARTEKMMLGPVSNSAIMLAEIESDGVLGIGTGIETTLAAMQIFGVPGWATGSDGGMRQLAVWLRDNHKSIAARVSRLLIWADRKRSGVAAAGELWATAQEVGFPADLFLPQSDDDFNKDLIEGFVERGIAETPQPSATKIEIEENIDPLTKLVREFNKKYLVVDEQGLFVIYEPRYDNMLKRNSIVRMKQQDFKQFYQNRLVTVVKRDGKTETKTKAEWWLNHPDRREFLGGVVFDPKNTVNKNQYNLWTGFSIEPKKGDWSLLQDHIFTVVCQCDQVSFDYLMGWVARMFQRPDLPGEVAVVLRGEKGVGKGIFFNSLIESWGQHGIHISNARHLIGNFNSHLRDCVALFADEAFFAGDRQHEGTLKALITEPTIPIEGKYQNVISVKNMLHVMMASNSQWVVPASLDERRYFVLDVADSRRGNYPYFSAIANQMENGGLSAMLYDLLNEYNIEDFEVRDVPQTSALIDQKLNSLDSIDRWIYDMLNRGFVWKSRFGSPSFNKWFETCSTELLWESYLQWCAETRPYTKHTKDQVCKRLYQIYESVRPRGSQIIYEIKSLNGPIADTAVYAQRQRCCFFGGIDTSRDRFTEITGLKIEMEY